MADRKTPVTCYCPDKTFPSYSYVPGRAPHPTSDPAGHSFGEEVTVTGFDPERWQDCLPYLFGIDLFNAGFYWEAHEQWEAVWLAVGRTGSEADLLKGLIKLAAAGVKVRERQSNGVRRHALRAAQLFGMIRGTYQWLLGFTVDDLLKLAREIESGSDRWSELDSEEQFPRRLFPILELSKSA